MSDKAVQQQEDQITFDDPSGAGGPTGRQILFRVMGIVLISLAILLAIYGTVAYVAWQRGQTERAESIQQALDEELEKQLAFARDDIAAGNYALALRRIEWILERDPGFPDTLSLQRQAQELLNARLTPTATPLPTPTSMASVEESGPSEADMARSFSELEQLVEEETWKEALEAIVAFQSQYPGYRRRDTDTLLFDTYISYGIQLLSGEQVEQGLFYLAQAEKLGDLPVEALDNQTWAELYLLGIGYYGVDWGTAIYYFRGLCAAAPYFQDACVKFRQALVAYGDQYATLADWCPAQDLFAEAMSVERSENLGEKLEAARLNCLNATPTPTAAITGTLGITATSPITGTIPASPE